MIQIEKYLGKSRMKTEERGRREGIKEGIKEERFTIARALLDILDNETIALKTGLSVEEVADLRTENKK